MGGGKILGKVSYTGSCNDVVTRLICAYKYINQLVNGDISVDSSTGCRLDERESIPQGKDFSFCFYRVTHPPVQ
jgi:hypothetical protein